MGKSNFLKFIRYLGSFLRKSVNSNQQTLQIFLTKILVMSYEFSVILAKTNITNYRNQLISYTKFGKFINNLVYLTNRLNRIHLIKSVINILLSKITEEVCKNSKFSKFTLK